MKNSKLNVIMAAVVFGVGALFVTMGVNADDNQVIMDKGVVVCTECVGIGDKIFPPMYGFVWSKYEDTIETPKAAEKTPNPTDSIPFTKPTDNPIF